MFEQLLDLVKSHAGKSIVDNPDIPNDRNEEAIDEASSSIAGGLQGILSQGGLKDLLKMFGGQSSASNAVTNSVSGGFIQNLMDRFGINQQQAGNIADNIVPGVLDDMVKKTNDPQDNSFDIQGIFNSLSKGQTSGLNLQGVLDRVKSGSLDLDGDGDTDLQDLMALFKGNSGGLLDKVKSIFR